MVGLDGRRGAAPHADHRPGHLLVALAGSEYWVKGETSGHAQHVHEVRLDCDGDAVLVVVDQNGAACHTGDRTCFDADVLLVRVARRTDVARAPALQGSGPVEVALQGRGHRADHGGVVGRGQRLRA